jgi:hypothetical protein
MNTNLSRCKKCNAAIQWVKTASGKQMPVDAATAKPDDLEYDHARMISHFATCKFANEFRKPKQ